MKAFGSLVYKPTPSAWSKKQVTPQMLQGTIFKVIKFTFELVPEAQIWFARISQQGQDINGELLPAMYW